MSAPFLFSLIYLTMHEGLIYVLGGVMAFNLAIWLYHLARRQFEDMEYAKLD